MVKGVPLWRLWSAKNPIFVIAQVYLNGVSAGEAYLSEVGSQVYAVGTNGYDITENVKSRLAARGDQMITNQTSLFPLGSSTMMPRTTAFSIEDCQRLPPSGTQNADYGTVYVQAGDSDAWQTQYAAPSPRWAVDSRQSLSGPGRSMIS